MPTDIHPRVRAELAAMGCTPEVAAALIDPIRWPPRGKDDAFVTMRHELAWRLRQPDPRTGAVFTYADIARMMNRTRWDTVKSMIRHYERAKSAVTGGESEAAA